MLSRIVFIVAFSVLVACSAKPTEIDNEIKRDYKCVYSIHPPDRMVDLSNCLDFCKDYKEPALLIHKGSQYDIYRFCYNDTKEFNRRPSQPYIRPGYVGETESQHGEHHRHRHNRNNP